MRAPDRTDLKIVTNAFESLHVEFICYFNTPRPDIYGLVTVLKKIQVDFHPLKIIGNITNKPKRIVMKRVLKGWKSIQGKRS